MPDAYDPVFNGPTVAEMQAVQSALGEHVRPTGNMRLRQPSSFQQCRWEREWYDPQFGCIWTSVRAAADV